MNFGHPCFLLLSWYFYLNIAGPKTTEIFIGNISENLSPVIPKKLSNH